MSDVRNAIRVYDEDNDDYDERNFNYSVYENGECILAFGRNNEDGGDFQHYTPDGHNEIHRSPFGQWGNPDE